VHESENAIGVSTTTIHMKDFAAKDQINLRESRGQHFPNEDLLGAQNLDRSESSVMLVEEGGHG